MKKTTIESLEKRVAALEKDVARVMQSQQSPGKFKDWRKAVANANRTDLAKEVDAAARKVRDEDRRKAKS